MHFEKMTDRIETDRLVLFPYTQENLHLFNTDLPAFEETYGVVYRGEELDYLLKGFLIKLEQEIADDPDHYLFFTEFLIVLRENSHIIGSIDYKYVPKDGVTEVGYGLNPTYTGRGYMTEALEAFLRFGKAQGIDTVRADTLSENIKSQNVLRRCGFTFLRREEKFLWWEIDLGTDCSRIKNVEYFGDNYSGFTDRVRRASRGILLRDGNILLSHETNPDQWMIPGGGIEGDETPEECCVREFAEETGVLVKPGRCFLILSEFYENVKYVSYYYLCSAVGTAERNPTQREIEAGAQPEWIGLDEAVGIFSRHADYTETDEERRGLYLREFTALREMPDQ